ncbi:MAG: patatin-like phospholipase family protein [Flavobacteriales bacterium]|nr:patatin-like phospholipase family protein [Flavobacteriales bacterium]
MSKSTSSFLTKLIYFFPLQLFFVHIKKNQQLLFFWLILFLAIFGELGLKYGIPYLFLAPEYLGELSFASYFIIGFAIGGFVVAYNISSYIMNGFRFPFLATLSKPFFKYSLNNSFIPSLFLACYFVLAYNFLSENENFTQADIFIRLLGFSLGYILFTLGSTLYFLATNKDFEKLFGKEIARVLAIGSSEDKPAKALLQKEVKKWYQNNDGKNWRVETYLNGRLKLRATRKSEHYDEKMLSQVFRQNHINASLFQISIIAAIIFLGLFRENDYFIIPAGASVVLLFTILLMLSSAIRSWTKGWSIAVIISALFLLNFASKQFSFYYESKAYGLSYAKKADYMNSFKTITPLKIKSDLSESIERLEKWKAQTGEEKPKAIFVATSGGGSRAAMWSFLAMQHLDEVSDFKISKHMVLGTGSSGGMIGLAYYRELMLRKLTEEVDFQQGFYNLGKDILNPIIFTLTVNDALIRTQRFEQNGEVHWKDRGFIFEKQLHENTQYVLDKPLKAYEEAEKNAQIPSLIFTPSIINDSRRLIINNLPLSFLCQKSSENVDYQTLFQDNDANNINFSTILRMTASFPYVMPTTSLPTEPEIEVFDSGLKDNFGIKTTVNYIYQLREWLSENTSGIVILQVKDGLKRKNTIKKKSQSLTHVLFNPFGSLYKNLFEVQQYNNAELLSILQDNYKGSIKLYNYELNKSDENYISLSWHLQTKEKEQILNSISLASNLETEKQLMTLLNSNR